MECTILNCFLVPYQAQFLYCTHNSHSRLVGALVEVVGDYSSLNLVPTLLLDLKQRY